jgi:hypothetical protein
MSNDTEWLMLEKDFRSFQAWSPNLYATWSSLDNQWILCTLPVGQKDHFRGLIRRAAVAAGHREQNGEIDYWLTLLREYLLKSNSESITIEPHTARRLGQAGIKHGPLLTIQPLCRASADYCLDRASQARIDDEAEQKQCGTSIRRRYRRNEAIENVRALIRRMLDEGATHFQICQRLKSAGRPPRAEWRHLPWDKAYMCEEYRDSVCKWISKNCR